jgi:hypothetical protein
VVGSFKQRSIEGLRANRARLKQKGTNERKKERERELDAPISYNKTTQNDEERRRDKIYRKNTPRETKQTPLLIHTFAESPTFSYWPIPNIIILFLF